MKLPEYTFIVAYDEDDGFIATCVECPYLATFGDTRQQALTHLETKVASYWAEPKQLMKTPPKRLPTARILDILLGVRMVAATKRFIANMKGAP